MCGILMVKSKDNIYSGVRAKNLFEAQKHRGTNGFGLLEISEDKITVKRFTDEVDAIKALEESKSKEILFHHRIPTSTDNNVKTNHPIIVNHDLYTHNYYLVHNGIIQNDEDLKKEHEILGIEYSTVDGNKFNDSEALMHELILVIEGLKTQEEFGVKGSLAFIMLQTDKLNQPTKLFYGRNAFNPLHKVELGHTLVLKSEGNSLLDSNKLFEYNYETEETTIRDMKMDNIEEKTQKEFYDTITKIYEGRMLSSDDLFGLRKKEIIILMTAARRVMRRMLSHNESDTLAGKTGYYTYELGRTKDTIESLQIKLKYLI